MMLGGGGVQGRGTSSIGVVRCGGTESEMVRVRHKWGMSIMRVRVRQRGVVMVRVVEHECETWGFGVVGGSGGGAGMGAGGGNGGVSGCALRRWGFEGGGGFGTGSSLVGCLCVCRVGIGIGPLYWSLGCLRSGGGAGYRHIAHVSGHT